LDGGFDYLTATTTPKHPDWELFQQLGLQFVSEMENAGHTAKERRFDGYEGWQVGDTYYGKREDSAIWKTSGGLSRYVARCLVANEAAPKVTRADLQLTFEPGEGELLDLGRMLRELRQCDVGASALKRSKSATFYSSDVCTGFTLGHRSSETYLRAYLAGFRHPEKYPLNAVRFEVEWKRERAQQIYQAFTNSTDDVTLSGAYVSGSFLQYGITEPMQAELMPCNLPPITRCASDEKTLHWLTGMVCRVIENMVRKGYGDEIRGPILAALTPPPLERRHSLALEKERQKHPQENEQYAHTF
jgi:hypothetical protein